MRSLLCSSAAVLLLLLLIGYCSAQGYYNPVNAARKCRGFGTDTKRTNGDEWYTYISSSECEDCCQRCYISHFKTLINDPDCTYPGFCNEGEDEPCEVYMFIKTRPCNRCCNTGSHMYSLSEECDDGELIRTHSTLSTCEVQRFDVCIGPDHVDVASMFEDCTTDATFEMQAYEDTCEQIELKNCVEASTGALVRWIFNDNANYNGWPNDCFWDKHFRDSYASPCMNTDSRFRVECPPNSGGGAWLQSDLSEHELIPVDCDTIDEKRMETCTPFSPPAKK
jgi:hypothetical protein